MRQQKKLNKKAQEEMVGFVLIMLLVAVIFLVFLGIYLRQGPKEPLENKEISQFLDAIVEVTTSCKIGYTQLNVGRLIMVCGEDSGAFCSDGTKACDILRITIKNLTESSWEFSQSSPKTGYLYSITRETNYAEFAPPVLEDPPTISANSAGLRTIASDKILPGGINIYLEIITN